MLKDGTIRHCPLKATPMEGYVTCDDAAVSDQTMWDRLKLFADYPFGDTCVICADAEYMLAPTASSSAPPDPLAKRVSLKCGHVFHRGCIKAWHKVQKTCPTCRANVDVVL
jgi:hypothetical protein